LSKALPSDKQIKSVVKRAKTLLAKGLTQREAANKMDMSVRTFRRFLGQYAVEIALEENETSLASTALRVKDKLLRSPASIQDISNELDLSEKKVTQCITFLEKSLHSIHFNGSTYELSKTPAPQRILGNIPTYTSRANGEFLFGFTSDNHLCSKYERIDVLEALYTEFERAGVDRVFNAGNWIDGEARFNKFDIHVYGMENQLDYLVKHYPQRKGIVTYAVAGDDHEGWYCQREGIDIGSFAESKMQSAGRDDFKYMGYMEAFIRLQHAKTKVSNMLHLLHPGGGSAYAESYTVQKIVEGYEGGEKPAILLAGHYHKLGYNYIRNVHAIQTGCTQDVTPFARKKKLRYAVGGGICKVKMDPITGAVISCTVEVLGYFNKGFYNDRWSMSGSIVLPERVLNQN